MTITLRAPAAPPEFEKLYTQATDGIRRDARRIRDLAERYRALYRRRLEAWMRLRARLDAESQAPLELREECDRASRELAVVQTQLKRLEAAARQLETVFTYLSSADEPADASPSDEATITMAERVRLVEAKEEVRQRLAEEIHDGPAQVLANAIFQVEYLERVLDQGPRRAHVEIGYLRTMLRDGLDEVRSYISKLRPPALDAGLEAAIHRLAADYESRFGIGVRVAIEGLEHAVAPSAHASVLRIVQEALQNARKHAEATELEIELADGQLTIADNGRGFDVVRLATGESRNFGLQIMRERAELIGGHLQIESRQAEGTRIILRLPDPDQRGEP